ncbi:hypothetical protein QQX98_004922 [Neonectria punicea]|uniref:Beta-lactamase-related domain-containing protein n=1 Tax=Neonectria punicea TaxID=979145 RepID=A0ABR1H758_9HYPO
MAPSESMRDVENVFREVTRDVSGLPNAALIAVDKDGNTIHSITGGTFAPLSPTNTAPQYFTHDTVCWLASGTKLMTTIAALQVVERGLLSIDTDITSILPELSKAQILVDIQETGPVFRPHTRPITLKSLLTHSSGLVYDLMDPQMTAWAEWVRKNFPEEAARLDSKDPAEAFLTPLMFEPDEGWAYSPGLDWAEDGKLVTSDGAAMEALGLRNGALHVRESGGGGCFSTANNYIKMRQSMLQNDGKLLKPETVDQMFKPQLADPTHVSRYHRGPGSNPLMGNIPQGAEIDFGFGRLINVVELGQVGRRKGAMQWGGMPNLFWWISPENGVCGCYFQQLLPPRDKLVVEMYQRFEKAIYNL